MTTQHPTLFDITAIAIVPSPEEPPVTTLSAQIRKAIAEYDYPVLELALYTGETGGVEITDTRLVQSRLKHALTEYAYCMREADDYAGKGMTRRALDFYLFALLHRETADAAVRYLKAVGADYRDFLAAGSASLERTAA